jgi:hypothetical protein
VWNRAPYSRPTVWFRRTLLRGGTQVHLLFRAVAPATFGAGARTPSTGLPSSSLTHLISLDLRGLVGFCVTPRFSSSRSSHQWGTLGGFPGGARDARHGRLLFLPTCILVCCFRFSFNAFLSYSIKTAICAKRSVGRSGWMGA